jgi:hypothetical protein
MQYLLHQFEQDRARYLARLPEALPHENAFIEVTTNYMWYGNGPPAPIRPE